MPFRRKYRRSRRVYGRKRGKRMIKRFLRKRQKRGNLAVFKIRDTIVCNSSVGGVIEYRTNSTNPTDTFFTGVTAQDFVNLSGIYDQFRIYAVSVKYIPLLPNDESSVTGFAPLYTVIDYDDSTALTSVNQAINYENMKVKNMYRPWKVYYRIPKVTNLAGGTTIVGFGWFDMAGPLTTGAIKFYGTGFDVSTTYGTFIATWYIGCKNRR